MKSFSLVSLFLMVCLLCITCGCGGGDSNSPGFGCTAVIVNGIVVDVFDAVTHASIATNAVGTVQDGAYTGQLMPFSFDGVGNTISLAGAPERAGTYTVRVEKAGYAPFVQPNVVVTKNQCHVNVTTVNAQMQPL